MYEYLYHNFLPAANVVMSVTYFLAIVTLTVTTARNIFQRNWKNAVDILLLASCAFGLFAVWRYIVYTVSILTDLYQIETNRFLRPSFPFAMMFGVFCTSLLITYQLQLYNWRRDHPEETDE